MYRKTYMKINLDNIRFNIKTILNKYNQYQYYFGVVKANCYSHDKLIIEELIQNGINYLAVSSLEEAINIRNTYKTIPILCLQPIPLHYIHEIIKYNITITIGDYQYYQTLSNISISSKIKVHIKLNTGMNRLGINNKEELIDIINSIKDNSYIELEGIYSHLATADNNDDIYNEQKNKFINMLENISTNQIPIIHLFNSSALLKFDKIDICNGVRLGIMMYGINPVKDQVDFNLKPTISLHSHIYQINYIKKGEYVGYGANYVANNNEIIATIPIGYADGFIRKNQGRDVLINNQRYQIVGRVCMDMIMVRIDNHCHFDDEVELFGKTITIEEVAEYLDTISWEVICSINDRVTRLFIKNDKIVGTVNGRLKGNY